MNEKIIAPILAAVLGILTITSNALAFDALNSFVKLDAPIFNFQNPTESKDPDQEKDPSLVDERNLGEGIVPDLVGLSVADAGSLRTLSGFDFVFFETDQTDYLTELPLDKQTSKSIFVCKQALPGGANFSPTEAPNSIEVVVSSDCKGKVNPYLVGVAKKTSTDWEPIRPTDETQNVIQGWVYGFGGETENVKVVQVLTYSGIKTFELAMIDLVGTSGCGLEEVDWETYKSKAIDSKHRQLPIGSPVSAVLNWMESNENEAFFHLLNASTGSYTLEPPAGSVNEALVIEGYWIPEGQHVSLGPEYVAEKKQKWVSSDGWIKLTQLGKSYRKLLLASANKMRKTPQATLATCIAYETKAFVSVYGSMDVRWKYGIPGGKAPAGCTWVNSYIRRGRVVSGYWRC